MKQFSLFNNTIQLQHNIFSYTDRMCFDPKGAIIKGTHF
jgi:hypothetical protein